ncbi:MAG TPA: hypothetical protein VH040_13950 [Usitatibacter sp.]|jgi:hypothetical protein|nr:hypothetical protein [Usitatibacter sp.]
MKEIQKKDLPGISGGQVSPGHVIGPVVPMPYPQTPAGPIGGPTDPYDPLGDGTQHKQV